MMPGRFRARLCATALFALSLGSAAACAQGTRLWTESRFEDYERGTPNGVAITSDGRLIPGPESTATLGTAFIPWEDRGNYQRAIFDSRPARHERSSLRCRRGISARSVAAASPTRLTSYG